MKTKRISHILIVVIVVVTVANLTSILDVDTKLSLKFGHLEALAWDEEEEGGGPSFGGTELRRGKCEDGVEEYVSCEWDSMLEKETCGIIDELDCSPGNTPTNPGGTTNNPNCVQFGHMYTSTICFVSCLRCNYTERLCD